ncbi:cytochrome P450 [Xylariaceae sp. FL0255]|nr:cytochrome P450 [Xylariaceae sp. FL0255]
MCSILSLLVGYGGGLCILFFGFVWSYRLLLHPLRKYPGPLIAQASDAYCGYFAVKRCLHLQTYKNLLRYGPVLRQSPNRLVFNSNEHFAKFHLYSAAQPDLQNRNLVSRVLADRSLRSFEPTMLHQVNIFLKQLFVSSNQPINLTPRCRYLGLDIAGHLGFGYDINLQTEDTYRFLFSPEPQPNDAKNDLLAAYRNETDTDVKRLTQSNLWTEAVFFFQLETVAVTLAAAFFYLSLNRDCYDQLAKEIRSTFRDDEDISSGPRLSSCRYLRACIDVTLRMSPPVPCTLWREAASNDQPLTVGGHVIPPGTQVGVNIYSLHHNAEYFPSPFEYMPDRWLGDTTAKMAKRDAFVPFSVGTRSCEGKTMAYLEVSLVLAKTLWHFDFELAPEDLGNIDTGKVGNPKVESVKANTQIYDNFAASHDGPVLVFHPRAVSRENLK